MIRIYLLTLLMVVTLAMVGLLLIPRPPLNEHVFDVDPLDDGEHVGRHRSPYEDGPTTRLGDSRLRSPYR